MPRPMWKGNISFGLVIIPVSMYSGEQAAAQLDLDMIDARDGQRVRYKRVNEKTGKEVPWKSIAKGYMHEGDYVVLSDADFKKAGEQIVRGIEIQEFVPDDSISPLYFQRPYYLAPGKGGEKAYALLREALVKTKHVGVAKAVIHKREHLAALTVVEGVLTLMVLRFAEELRAPSDLEIAPPAKRKVNPRELSMAQELVKGMAGKWEPEKYHDEYRDALKSFIEKKIAAGGKTPKPKAEEEDEEEAPASYSIMELLKKSMAQKKPARGAGKPARKTRRKAG